MNMEEILNGGRETVLSAHGPLSRFWRLLLHNIGISYMRWKNISTNHYDNLTQTLDKDAGESTMTNHINALCGDDMSWASFIRGLHVLPYQRIKIEFVATRNEELFRTEMELCTRNVASNLSEAYSLETIKQDTEELSRIWEHFHKELTKNKSFTEYLKEYSQKEFERTSANGGNGEEKIKPTSSIRSSLKKKLFAKTISWKGFQEGMTILEVERLDIVLHLTVFKTKRLVLKIQLK